MSAALNVVLGVIGLQEVFHIPSASHPLRQIVKDLHLRTCLKSFYSTKRERGQPNQFLGAGEKSFVADFSKTISDLLDKRNQSVALG